MSRPEGGVRGSALLLVVASSAAVATLAALLLAAALIAYETTALRVDGEQARLLAVSGLAEVGRRLASGALQPGTATAPVIWQGVLPDPPAGFPPLRAGGAPVPDAPPGGGCGYRVALVRVLGPTGMPRWWPESPPVNVPTAIPDPGGEADPGTPAALVDAVASGWCGRGRALVEARFAVRLDGRAIRLH